MIKNSKGQIYYGMHFYPGVAEYQEPAKEPYRIFINENTIREMGPTFAGRPVFVQHVEDVTDDLNELRSEADGWVVESFFNQADGKHWVKFIVVSERGERAIKQGMRLSNCYAPKGFGQGGMWNGVTYAKEITNGEYEHLAIVPNPRYEESVIMNPEKFKQYNESQSIDLKRLANDNGKEPSMKLQLFKKAKVDNDLSEMSVLLPKSGREISITQLVADADARAVKNDDSSAPPPPPASSMPKLDPGGVASIKKAFGNEGLADPLHKVKLHDGSYCNVSELVDKHKAMSEELEAKKKDAMESDTGLEEEAESVEVEGDDKSVDNAEGKDMPHGDSMSDVEGGESKKNEDDEDDKAKLKAVEKDKEVEAEKKKNAKEKADRLRNAHLRADEPVARVDLPEDQVARGKARYGS